jgi:hypothetical protein
MNLLFFLKERLDFVIFFFDMATESFLLIMSNIENKLPPYVQVYDESGSPQYLDEWIDASTGFEAVGVTSLSMVSSSLQLFLDEWVKLRLETKSNSQFKRTHKKGWFHAYCKIFEEVGIDTNSCPANLQLIEQVVLARNRSQHPEDLTMIQVAHSKSDLTKYPNPYFVVDTYQSTSNAEQSWWMSPRVYVDRIKLDFVITEVEKFCIWLENIFSIQASKQRIST